MFKSNSFLWWQSFLSAASTPAFLNYMLEFGNTVNILEPLKQWILKETNQPNTCTDIAHSACSVMSASDSFHYSCRAPEPLSTHPHTNTQAHTDTHGQIHTQVSCA